MSTAVRPLSLLLVSMLLTGCTVGPDYTRPETASPAGWAGLDVADVSSVPTGDAPDVAAWWNQFNDPILSDLIARADAGNLTLAQAEARIRQARAAQTVAASGLYPQVDASAVATRSRAVSGSAGASTNNLFRAGFDATWELDVFGGIRRGVEAAEARTESAYFDSQSVRVTVNAEVAAAYFTLRGAQRQLVIARENLKAQQETLEVTQDRYRAGFVGTLDVAQASARVFETTSQIPTVDAQVRSSIYAISVLLGQEPAALLTELTPDRALAAMPGAVPVGLPSELLRRRPDIRKADADLHTVTANIGVAVADQYPRFSLTGAFGTQGRAAASLGTLADRFWSIGPAVSLPIFNGGRVQGNIEASRAIAEQSVLSYRSTVLTALQDVETSMVNFTREQQRRDALMQAAAASGDAVATALELYNAGKTDFLSVLVAQGQLYSTESALAQSETTVRTNLVALYKALGGGWQAPETPTSAEPAEPASKSP